MTKEIIGFINKNNDIFNIKEDESTSKYCHKVGQGHENKIATFTEDGDIKDSNKTIDDLVTRIHPSVDGNLASFDENGNLQDSGKNVNDFAPDDHTHTYINSTSENAYAEIIAESANNEPHVDINLDDEDGEFARVTIDLNNINNLKRALTNPTTPISGGNNLITNGLVYESLQDKANSNHTHDGIEDIVENTQSAKLYANNRSQGEPAITIELTDNNTPGGSVTKSANIDIESIDNLNRALATPSSIPENDATKLITSKAVYDALAGKADVLKTLCINYDGQSQAETDYPISSSDKTLISTFIESVPENQYVPVIVMLTDENNADGTVIGLAKWNSSTSNSIPSIGVEVTIGKYKYTCADYTVKHLECWYRTAIGQFHLS